jgi:ACS family tartrate transporter-like MFS transporter
MPIPALSALDRARAKAYRRLLPLLFLCYIIAYVDRNNVSIAFDTMKQDLNDAWVARQGPGYAADPRPAPPPFNNDVLGTGFGVFFIGYFLLEIPGTLLVEKWSARKWISRIMISWGIMAALTSFVKLPIHFYMARFLLGLAEAGFFPGVIVYLTHWFPSRDRAKALSWFLIGTPIAQFASPLLSYPLLKIGTDETVGGATVHYPEVLGLEGWQWIYVAWGIPAVVLGVVVLIFLTDRPGQARWLAPEEREALEAELEREKALHRAGRRHMGWVEALGQPKVLLLAAAYFFIVTGNYGVESFLPTILKQWYSLSKDQLRWLLLAPAMGSLLGQLFIGWSSDRTKERRLHAAVPIYLGAAALACTLPGQHPLALMMVLFTLAAAGLKAYLPAFWSLPSLFLTEAAAAGSIGFINSVGNLGGFIGPKVIGWVETETGSFVPGISFLCVSMTISATIIVLLGLGRRGPGSGPPAEVDPLPEPV